LGIQVHLRTEPDVDYHSDIPLPLHCGPKVLAWGAEAGSTLDEGLALNANRTAVSRLPTEVHAVLHHAFADEP
jgi:hypothetical protein